MPPFRRRLGHAKGDWWQTLCMDSIFHHRIGELLYLVSFLASFREAAKKMENKEKEVYEVLLSDLGEIRTGIPLWLGLLQLDQGHGGEGE